MRKIITSISVFLVISFSSCDEELIPPTFEATTSQEQLLINDWTYDYILMGTDTIRALTPQGEPRTTGILEAVNQFYRRYDVYHSYHYRWEEGAFTQREYGTGENYQPNVGYWHLSESEKILVHNKLTTYEKQFEIIELTDAVLKIKLIGDRTSYLTNGDGDVIDTLTTSWTEVFVPREIKN